MHKTECDCYEIFSSVINHISIRVLLVLVWRSDLVDEVETAFLPGDLVDDIKLS